MTKIRNTPAKQKRRTANRSTSELDETEALQRKILARLEAFQQSEAAAPSADDDPDQARRQRRRQRGRMAPDDPAHALREELATRLFRLAQSMQDKA